ncbi:hypothetical protein FOA52_015397 [Chlamydomonas sp. UWO 241]|nr:hypothetical protein FOA52_015397 [Chlamydomonas sp. UWO 241]
MATSVSSNIDCLNERFGLLGTASLQPGCAVKLKLKRGKGAAFEFPLDAAGEPTKVPTRAEVVRDAGRFKLLHKAAGVQEATEATLPAREFTVEGLDLTATGMLEQIRKALAPEAPSIRAKVYKLSIMPAGCRRSSAKPALPADPSCFGVLEVVLPSPFERGNVTMTYTDSKLESDFEVRIEYEPWVPSAERKRQEAAADQEKIDHEKARNKERLLDGLFCDVMPGSSAQAPAPAPVSHQKPSDEAEEEHPDGVGATAAAATQPGSDAAADEADAAHAARLRETAVRQLSLLEYCACMGDTEMCVGLMGKYVNTGPVTHGTRYSLIYTLHRDDTPSDLLLIRASAVHKALRKALVSPDFMPGGGKIGFYLQDHYMEAALAKAETKFAASQGVVSEASACNLPFKGKDAVVGSVLAASGLKLECLRMCSKIGAEQYVVDKMPTKKDDKNFAFHCVCCEEDQLERKTNGTVSSVIGDITWLGSHKPLDRDWCKLHLMGHPYRVQVHFTTSSAIIATVPPFATRTLSNVKLTIEHVRPFKVAKASKSAAKGKRKAQGGGSKQGGKRSKVEESAAEDEWDSDREERLEKELEADDNSDNDGEKENAPQRASSGRNERSGSRQVAAVAAEEEDNEEEVEEEEEAAPALGSCGDGGQGALRRPPVLFQPHDPSMMTEAQKKEAGLQVERSIHVLGGKGKNEDKFPDGKATIKLKPGDGLAQLKKKIKGTFGKVRQQMVGPLVLADAHGNPTSSNAAAADLVEGATQGAGRMREYSECMTGARMARPEAGPARMQALQL